jgi:hypothetical protein
MIARSIRYGPACRRESERAPRLPARGTQAQARCARKDARQRRIVMHRTHGCCGPQSSGNPPLFLSQDGCRISLARRSRPPTSWRHSVKFRVSFGNFRLPPAATGQITVFAKNAWAALPKALGVWLENLAQQSAKGETSALSSPPWSLSAPRDRRPPAPTKTRLGQTRFAHSAASKTCRTAGARHPREALPLTRGWRRACPISLPRGPGRGVRQTVSAPRHEACASAGRNSNQGAGLLVLARHFPGGQCRNAIDQNGDAARHAWGGDEHIWPPPMTPAPAPAPPWQHFVMLIFQSVPFVTCVPAASR